MPKPDLRSRAVETLYVEAMILADEARSYFDDRGRADRERLPAATRCAYSVESLRITTRLMHVIAWLLCRRAVAAGEITEEQARDDSRSLGVAPASDEAATAMLPDEARLLIHASCDLHARVAALEAAILAREAGASPARELQRLVEEAYRRDAA